MFDKRSFSSQNGKTTISTPVPVQPYASAMAHTHIVDCRSSILCRVAFAVPSFRVTANLSHHHLHSETGDYRVSQNSGENLVRMLASDKQVYGRLQQNAAEHALTFGTRGRLTRPQLITEKQQQACSGPAAKLAHFPHEKCGNVVQPCLNSRQLTTLCLLSPVSASDGKRGLTRLMCRAVLASRNVKA